MYDVLDRIANEVVIRHVCHCDGAAQRPDGESPIEHAFIVDGEDFPWHISDRGPIVKQVADDLYTINVEILQVDKTTLETLAFGYTQPYGSVPFIPVIGGREFPWLCDDSGYTLRFGHKTFPVLTLSFYAHKVDANIEVGDHRRTWVERAVYCAGGDAIRVGKDKCFWCDELRDAGEMLDHHKQAHPERVKVGPDGLEGYRTS